MAADKEIAEKLAEALKREYMAQGMDEARAAAKVVKVITAK